MKVCNNLCFSLLNRWTFAKENDLVRLDANLEWKNRSDSDIFKCYPNRAERQAQKHSESASQGGY